MASDKPDSFQCGPFEVARNPNVSQFVEKLNRLREAVDQCRLQPGVGYTLNRSSGGTSLTIKNNAGGVSAPLEHPFKLKIRQKQNTTFELWCNPGLVGDGKVKTDNTEKWVTFQNSARIYLEASISDLSIQTLTIKTQDPNKEFKRTEISGGKQSYARISLGLYVPEYEGSKTYKIIQNVTTDIMTPLFCFSGYPALALTQEFVNAYYA